MYLPTSYTQMSKMINVSGTDSAEVLCALYKHARATVKQFPGLDWIPDYKEASEEVTPAEITVEEAKSILKAHTTMYLGRLEQDLVHHIHGKVMMLRVSADFLDSSSRLDPEGYDRFNGKGACLKALDPILKAASEKKMKELYGSRSRTRYARYAPRYREARPLESGAPPSEGSSSRAVTLVEEGALDAFLNVSE